MERYTTIEIGSCTFFVFANGMVRADEVLLIQFDETRAFVITRERLSRNFTLRSVSSQHTASQVESKGL